MIKVQASKPAQMREADHKEEREPLRTKLSTTTSHMKHTLIIYTLANFDTNCIIFRNVEIFKNLFLTNQNLLGRKIGNL
jgi:hypothetical protein